MIHISLLPITDLTIKQFPVLLTYFVHDFYLEL